MQQAIYVDGRFCGPPDSGNGGYTCGLAAKSLGGCVEVRLRKPIPLNQNLTISANESGREVNVSSGNALIMSASRSSLELDVPPPPSVEETIPASQNYAGFESHIFPTCFVCGPERKANDGLRIFAGPTKDQRLVAALWAPHDSLSNSDGKVRSEFVWAALDCPGAFAFAQNGMVPAVLGTMTAKLNQSLDSGRNYRVIGWEIGREERKLYAGTAIFSESGELCAAAKAIWIAISS